MSFNQVPIFDHAVGLVHFLHVLALCMVAGKFCTLSESHFHYSFHYFVDAHPAFDHSRLDAPCGTMFDLIPSAQALPFPYSSFPNASLCVPARS